MTQYEMREIGNEFTPRRRDSQHRTTPKAIPTASGLFLCPVCREAYNQAKDAASCCSANK